LYVTNLLVHGEIGGGGEEPAVAELTLVDVEPVGPALHQARLSGELPRPQPLQVRLLAEEDAGAVRRELWVLPQGARLQAGRPQLLKVLTVEPSLHHNRLRLVQLAVSDTLGALPAALETS
jgi:hypothetical protein